MLKRFKQKKPYSAITVQVDRLTSEQYEADDLSGIVDLIEVIRLQAGGPAEAARAIRKKLKYGNVHKQLRALSVLDALIENAGSKFQRAFADEPLLERLRIVATDSLSDAEVQKKCQILFREWSVDYKSTPGMERIAALEKQLPQRKRPPRQGQSKVLKEFEPDANEDPFASHDPQDPGAESSTQSHRSPTRASFFSKSASITPGSSLASLQKPSKSKYDKSSKKSKPKPFNLEKEKPQLLETLASSSVASTNLMNALKLINREKKRVSEDRETVQRFEVCKMLRKQILRYIQHVESEQWLGSLIHANEELVTALMAFEVLDKSLEDDSDSENNEWDNKEPPTNDSPRRKSVHEAFAGLSIDKSPRKRPPMISLNGKERASDVEDDNNDDDDDAFSEEDNPDDPFGDSHAVHTPKGDRPGMTWREV